MTKQLKIAADLQIPVEAVTQTFAILAKRGMGKTYTAAVLTEEMLDQGQQVVVMDPIGVWWGLRAAADGKGEGFPIIVMGGDHGDVPLEVSAGETIADFVVQEGQSVVLDLSLFRKGEQTRFVTDFLEKLYHKNRAPLHVMMDEADAFAPQRPQHGQERCLGAVEDLVRRGRARGIGVTLVTQRAAVLNKDVLTQAEVLVALRTIAPQDREAIDAWIKVHGTPEQRSEMMESLPSLAIGNAWFWSPGWLDIFQRVKVRLRKTFDSSATPSVGQQRTQPKRLAPVDLQNLSQRISATIARVKAEDPRELKRQIQELQRKLSAAPKVVHPKVERVDIPMLKEDQIHRLEVASRNIHVVGTRLLETGRLISEAIGKSIQTFKASHQPAAPIQESQIHRLASGDGQLAKSERLILTALAQYPELGRSKVQVAIMTGYSVNSGGFNNSLAKLRSTGMIAGSGDSLKIQAQGVEMLGAFDRLPLGAELLNHWLNRLPKCERMILDVLSQIYPNSLSKDGLADKCGYSANSGGFNNALSRLRTLELITRGAEIKASENLF